MNQSNLYLVTIATMATFSGGQTLAAPKQQQPNIIFIYADDMGKGMLSANGQKYIKTPNIDKIFNRGVQFANAYGCHYSAPARAALMTGYSDCTKGKWTTTGGGKLMVDDTTQLAAIEAPMDAKRTVLPEGDDYLPEVLNKAGYVTGAIGKLGFSFFSTRKEMKIHGWDYYYGYLDHQACHGYYPPYVFENGKVVMIDGNTHRDCAKNKLPYMSEKNFADRWNMEGKAQYSQFLFDEKIEEFIIENRDKPFFLYHPSQLSHGPISVPYIHEKVKNMKSLTPLEKEYATMVLLLDESVGKIMALLEREGIADNTMLIFSADNGHEVYVDEEGKTSPWNDVKTGEPIDYKNISFRSEVVGDKFNGNMGMLGKKRSSYQGGVCVPLAYYMPKVTQKRVVKDIVANYDMIATFADMFDIDICKDKDAVSYLSLLQDADAHLPQNRVIAVSSKMGPAVMRNDGWKLVFNDKKIAFELYNINNDYRELNNLVESEPVIVDELKVEMERLVSNSAFKTFLKKNSIKLVK